jgi:hypothetical protein
MPVAQARMSHRFDKRPCKILFLPLLALADRHSSVFYSSRIIFNLEEFFLSNKINLKKKKSGGLEESCIGGKSLCVRHDKN